MSVKPPSQVPIPPEGNKDWGPLINITDGWIEALDLVVMVLRILTRLKLTESKLWWDDYFILAALGATLWQLAGNGILVHYGFGRPEHFLTDHELKMFLAYSYGEWIQTFFTLQCTKISMCFFLLRLPASKNLIRPLQAAIIFLIGSGLIIICLWATQCHPTEMAWNINLQGGCYTKDGLLAIIMTHAIISIVSDFALSFYPVLILKNLQMTKRSKIGLCILMGLGAITGICAIVRTVMYRQWIADDITYGGVENWFWRTFEVNLGIICVCIPTLIPGWKWLRRKLRHRAQRNLPNGVAPNGLSPGDDRQEKREIKHPEPTTARDASRTERKLLGRYAQDLESQTPTGKVQVEDDPQLPSGHQKVAMVLDKGDVDSTLKKGSEQSSSGPPTSWFSSERGSSGVDTRDNSPGSSQSQAPLVRNTGDPEKALDVNLQPSFSENRSVWRRMLHRVNPGNRSSFMLKTTNPASNMSHQD